MIGGAMIQDVAENRTVYSPSYWRGSLAFENWHCQLCEYAQSNAEVMKHHLEQEHLLSPVFIGFSSMYVVSHNSF
jgi:hypothetical protein